MANIWEFEGDWYAGGWCMNSREAAEAFVAARANARLGEMVRRMPVPMFLHRVGASSWQAGRYDIGILGQGSTPEVALKAAKTAREEESE